MAKRRHSKSGRHATSVTDRATTVVPPAAGRRSVVRPTKSAPHRSATAPTKRPISRQLIVGIIAAVVVVLIAGGGAYVLMQRNAGTTGAVATPGSGATAPSNAATEGDLLGVPVADEGRTHVAEGSAISYKHNPPASGPHYPSPKPWGIYTDTVPPGYWVHDLEHGGVVVLYDCPSGCSQVVTALQQAFTTFPKDKYNEVKLVATPYSGLPKGTQVMAVAWDYQKSYASFDTQKLLTFYNGHVDRGPEDIP